MSKEFDDLDDEPLEEQDDQFAELSPEEYEKLIEEIENFNSSFLSHLAGTANYEIVPTEPEDGAFLSEEHYRMIKKECAKIGAVILYSYKIGNLTLVVNPKNMKTIVLNDGEAH